MPQKNRILTLHPGHIPNYGIGHAAYAISHSLSNKNFETLILSSSIDKTLISKYQKALIPQPLKKVSYSLFSEKTIKKATEAFFLKHLRHGDIAYLWPGCSYELFQEVKKRGNLLLMESINCHQKTCQTILDLESTKLNLTNTHNINDENILDENSKLKLSDFVFSPNPIVSQSLLENGVSTTKIIDSSYGLNSHQKLTKTDTKTSQKVTAIFVGRVGMRKGIHLLLDYWLSANIDGTLKIIGNIEPSIEKIILPYRNSPNIEFIEFASNLDDHYSNADFFILPSLEEGSPLVTYLALGAALPSILSPMAGTGVITDNRQGFIIDPHNKEEWVAAIKKIATVKELREKQGKAAYELSDYFIWEKVGQRRADALINKIERK
jgi:glycosyltransferase involved in cell wall biosynthesis